MQHKQRSEKKHQLKKHTRPYDLLCGQCCQKHPRWRAGSLRCGNRSHTSREQRKQCSSRRHGSSGKRQQLEQEVAVYPRFRRALGRKLASQHVIAPVARTQGAGPRQPCGWEGVLPMRRPLVRRCYWHTLLGLLLQLLLLLPRRPARCKLRAAPRYWSLAQRACYCWFTLSSPSDLSPQALPAPSSPPPSCSPQPSCTQSR